MGDERQVVGWPPVRNSRKTFNFLAKSSFAETQDEVFVASAKPTEQQGSASYVKVNMDGVGIGRKVDLNSHGCFQTLAIEVDKMFQANKEINNNDKGLGVLDPAAEYVLTYQDGEGDWMLAGDVPWKMFVNDAKRLRIMHTSSTRPNKKRRLD